MTARSAFSRLRVAVAVLAATTAFSLPALAEWEVFKGANVKFHVPDAWDTKASGDVVVTRPAASDKKENEVFIEFIAIDEGPAEVKKVEMHLMKVLEKKFDHVKIKQKGKKIKQHGHNGFVFGGTAKDKDGNDINWMSAVLHTGKDTGVAVLAAGTPVAFKKHKTGVAKTLDSIQALRD